MENEIKIENAFITTEEQQPVQVSNEIKIANLLSGEKSATNDNIIPHIPFVLSLAVIAIFYIWNSHQTEKMIREKNKIGKQLNELRWEYMTSKNELMFKSKQTEVMKLLQDSTLQVLTSAPKKIVVKK